RVRTQPWRRTSCPARPPSSPASARGCASSLLLVTVVVITLLREDPRAWLGGPWRLDLIRGYAPSLRVRGSSSELNGTAASMGGSLSASPSGVNAPVACVGRSTAAPQDALDGCHVRRVLGPARRLLEAQHGLEAHARHARHRLGAVHEDVQVLAHPAGP